MSDMMEEEWLDLSSLPDYCSREFDPTPEELITRFLRNHILKQSYPESGTIQEETVFGEEEMNPWDKFCDPHNPYPWETSTSIPTLYLFTKLTNLGVTDKSFSIQKNRKAGRGTWHGSTSPIKVTSSADDGVVVGYYKVLSFRLTDGTETKGQWIMYEFSISGEAFPEIRKVRDWQNQVVCLIKRDDTKSNIGGKVTKIKSQPIKPPKNPVPKKRKSSPKAVPNKRRRIAEAEEKPIIVDNAEFVNQEPARDDCLHYGELTGCDDLGGIDMDELFDGVECV